MLPSVARVVIAAVAALFASINPTQALVCDGDVVRPLFRMAALSQKDLPIPMGPRGREVQCGTDSSALHAFSIIHTQREAPMRVPYAQLLSWDDNDTYNGVPLDECGVGVITQVCSPPPLLHENCTVRALQQPAPKPICIGTAAGAATGTATAQQPVHEAPPESRAPWLHRPQYLQTTQSELEAD